MIAVDFFSIVRPHEFVIVDLHIMAFTVVYGDRGRALQNLDPISSNGIIRIPFVKKND